METSVTHREEYVRRWKPFKMGKHGYDCIVAAFSHSVWAMKMFLSLIVLTDFCICICKKLFFKSFSLYHNNTFGSNIRWNMLTRPGGMESWLACNFRPVLKMLNKMGNLRGEQHRVAEVPQNCQLLTRSFLSVDTRNWSNIYVSTTFRQCVECTWTNSSVVK